MRGNPGRTVSCWVVVAAAPWVAHKDIGHRHLAVRVWCLRLQPQADSVPACSCDSLTELEADERLAKGEVVVGGDEAVDGGGDLAEWGLGHGGSHGLRGVVATVVIGGAG